MISLRRAHRYRARAAWRVKQSPIRRYVPPSSRSEVTLWYQFRRSIRTQENGQVSRGSACRCEGPFRFIKKGSNHDRYRSQTPRLLVLCPKDPSRHRQNVKRRIEFGRAVAILSPRWEQQLAVTPQRAPLLLASRRWQGALTYSTAYGYGTRTSGASFVLAAS